MIEAMLRKEKRKFSGDYESFGVELEPSGNDTTDNKYRFTGQERDTHTNYDYMHFRFYASSMGRFLKPDNMIPNAANPQSWNLYSYVNGNPVNFNDPSGHWIHGGPDPTYIQRPHSFGMSWFDQFSSDWLPWAGQTQENSLYWGTTRDAFHYWSWSNYSSAAANNLANLLGTTLEKLG